MGGGGASLGVKGGACGSAWVGACLPALSWYVSCLRMCQGWKGEGKGERERERERERGRERESMAPRAHNVMAKMSIPLYYTHSLTFSFAPRLP